MRLSILLLCLVLLCPFAAAEVAPPNADAPIEMDETIVDFETYDGMTIQGKLRMPEGDAPIEKLVIFVNGSGPNTYDNRRDLGGGYVFDYFGLFADQIVPLGAAFFSYNTRGVTPSDTPPMFNAIDEDAYQTYLPDNSVQDVTAIIETLHTIDRLADAKIILLGWSEGTMIAPKVAAANPGTVDALLLAGYLHDTMEDVLLWQQSGGSSMVFYAQYFDADRDGEITPAEIEADPYGVLEALGITAFDDLDINLDGALTQADFSLMLTENRTAVLNAFENGDDAWLQENYAVRLTGAWYQAHKAFPPNRDMLTTVDAPVYIFHGEFDANTPASQALAAAADFEAAGLDSIEVTIVPDADHDLNILQMVTQDTVPEGISAILDVIDAL